MPVRWLIGPGLLMVGGGLLLMRGLDASSDWTHLIPGFLVAGLGSGLVNPPLASTAVGVVEPRFAGMASGINSTFRQVGIATSVAALGTILATHTNGVTGAATKGAFVSGLNEILLISGLLAIVGGVLAFPLIRRKDFHVHVPEGGGGRERRGSLVRERRLGRRRQRELDHLGLEQVRRDLPRVGRRRLRRARVGGHRFRLSGSVVGSGLAAVLEVATGDPVDQR